MHRKITKLNGICDDLNKLSGINFSFIPAVKEINLPLCSVEKICKAKDFNRQRNRCRDIVVSSINKSKRTDFRVQRFSCGLSEFILPIFNNGNLRGVILTNQIKEKNSCAGASSDSCLPAMDPKQIVSLASLLNYCRPHFKETVSALQPGLVPNTKDKLLIERAKNFIERSYHRPDLSLKDLTKEINTSYFRLCRLFKKRLDMTFTQYVTLVRLKAALRLLQNLNLSVAQVAYAVGISDAQYFDRVFKKILGCRPKDYRFSAVNRREKTRLKVLSQLP
ncbi:MAG: helix-turn-helix domain-containing protein [Candidatus Omnitrophota bacterium]